MSGRFEVIQTDDGWHARFKSGSRIVWSTQVYKQKRSAVYAIDSLARAFSPTRQVWIGWTEDGGVRGVDIRYGSEGHSMWMNAHRLDVVLLDKRIGGDR